MNDITNVLRHVFIDSQSLCNAVNGATLRLQVCDHVTLPAAVAGSRRSKQTTCLIYVFNVLSLVQGCSVQNVLCVQNVGYLRGY